MRSAPDLVAGKHSGSGLTLKGLRPHPAAMLTCPGPSPIGRQMVMLRARVLALTILASAAAATTALSGCGSSSSSKVLTVGSFHGKPGEFSTISRGQRGPPGDWILIGPGDYHETADAGGPQGAPAAGDIGGVYINKADLHIRGMDRNTVVVDGTKPGSPECSLRPGGSELRCRGTDGKRVGRNGILIWKADGVSVDDLTVCNFLAGTGDSGNQVWWNCGAEISGDPGSRLFGELPDGHVDLLRQ